MDSGSLLHEDDEGLKGRKGWGQGIKSSVHDRKGDAGGEGRDWT